MFIHQKKNVIGTSFIVICLLASCNNSNLYEDYVNFDDAFWHADSIQHFTFNISDTALTYSLYITIRNSSLYPYYNLFYQYTLADTLNQLVDSEQKEIHLFNPKTGTPYGNGLGDLFDHAFIIKENFKFSKPDAYVLSLQQFMRMDTLPYLLSVGARVTKEKIQ